MDKDKSQGGEENQKSWVPQRPRAGSVKETLNSKSGKGPRGFSDAKVTDVLLLLHRHWEWLFLSGLYFYLGFKLSVIAVRSPRVISS